MVEIAAIICNLSVKLYNDLIQQIDSTEEFEGFSLDAESKDGYSYKITISRVKISQEDV